MNCPRVLVLLVACVQAAVAAPLPNTKEAKKQKLEHAFLRLQAPWPGSAASQVIILCDIPEADVLRHLKPQIKPLKLSEDRAKELIAQLGSAKDAEAQAAFDELRLFDVRLAMKPTKAFEYAPQGVIRQRLTAAMEMYGADIDRYKWCKIDFTKGAMKQPDGKFKIFESLSLDNMPGKPEDFKTVFDTEFEGRKGRSSSFLHEVSEVQNDAWFRFARATFVLERMTHPDAKALLETMAEGHPDALPTVYAKAALKRKEAKPVPFDIKSSWVDMASGDDSRMCLAAVAMHQHLDTVTPFLAENLKAVSLSDKGLNQLLKDLGNDDDEKKAKQALEALTLNDPRYFKTLVELDKLPPNELSRSRLLEFFHGEKFDGWKGQQIELVDFGEHGCWAKLRKYTAVIYGRAGNHNSPITNRAHIAIELLKADPTPAAKKVLEVLAKGHPKATMTMLAIEALKSRL
jgi:hypothetical protein